MYAQRGSALFLILIAVALFAALSYAVTSSGRGQGTAQAEQAMLEAGYLMGLASRIDMAVQRIAMIGGCNLEEISNSAFQGEPVANPGPCNIYDKIDRGGAEYSELLSPSDSIYGTYAVHGADPKRKRIINSMDLWGTRTSRADAIFIVFNIKEETCKAINKRIGIVTSDGLPPEEDTPWEGGWSNPHPTGLINGNSNLTIGRTASGPPGGNELTGQRVGCYRSFRPGFPMGWHFYSVVVEY